MKSRIGVAGLSDVKPEWPARVSLRVVVEREEADRADLPPFWVIMPSREIVGRSAGRIELDRRAAGVEHGEPFRVVSAPVSVMRMRPSRV